MSDCWKVGRSEIGRVKSEGQMMLDDGGNVRWRSEELGLNLCVVLSLVDRSCPSICQTGSGGVRISLGNDLGG